MPNQKGLSRLVLLLWTGAILVTAMTVYLLVFSFPADSHASPAEPTSSPPPPPTATRTDIPSSTPTIPPATPTPTPSAIPPTSTPAAPQPEVIGYSLGGKPLEVYRFGSGPVQKLIVAGIHGGYEWNTIVLADELISYLETHPEVVPEGQTLYILRAFNPDGYERSRGFGGRANDNNVDLNRNFPFQWQADWARAGCWDYIPITGGSSAASEPETKALIQFVESHNLQAAISYHSAALGIFPGGQPPDEASLSLAEALAAVSDYPYPPIEAGCEYTGQLVDWLVDQGVAAVDVELTNHQDSDFEINLAVLSVFLDWENPLKEDQ